MALAALAGIGRAIAPHVGKVLPFLKANGGKILSGLANFAPLGMMGFGMIQSGQQAAKTAEMSKDMTEQMNASNNAIAAQFARSSGLSLNNTGALGAQQAVPGGQFPPGM